MAQYACLSPSVEIQLSPVQLENAARRYRRVKIYLEGT